MLLSQYFLCLIMLNFTPHKTDQQQLQACTQGNKNNMTVNQKMYILKKSHFVKKPVFSHWKVNFSDYLLPPKAQPIKPFSKDTNERPVLPLSSPSFQLVKKPSKPLLRAVASASMWKNICRSYLLPCCCFNFILAGLDHFISTHCKHLWLKAKGEF